VNRALFSDILDVRLWEKAWAEARSGFPLAMSQKTAPERWRAFFDSISDSYHATWGDQGGLGPNLADLLFSEGLVFPSALVLDAGSGPGTLALPLAERGARVTALDYADGMLRALSARAAQEGIDGIETVCAPFFEFEPSTKYDLVLACFFPAALSPEGIRRMESLSRGHCTLVLGAFGEQIPFRKALWREIMGHDPPSGAFHLIYVYGFLFSGKRAPNIKHLSWPYTFKRPLEETEAFFTSYFQIFDKKGPAIERRIRRVLKDFVKGGLVTCEAEVKIAAVWWRARGS
jgi:SAM-dependent methyltransferase